MISLLLVTSCENFLSNRNTYDKEYVFLLINANVTHQKAATPKDAYVISIRMHKLASFTSYHDFMHIVIFILSCQPKFTS